MFKHIKNRIVVSYLVVLLSCFLAVFITTSLFIRKTYFSYALNDLRDDAGLFIDDSTKDAITTKNLDLLKKIVNKAEENYTLEIFDIKGDVAVSSTGENIVEKEDFNQDEFKIIPSRGYGYAVRKQKDKIKMVYVAIPITKENRRIGFIRISTPLLYIERTISRLRLYVVFIFMFGIAVSLPVSIFLSKGISSPLLKIAKIAREVSSGNFQKRVEINNRRDEIGILAYTFNEMIERLKQVQEERRILLSNISHELMTPITSIRGFVETLYEGRMRDKSSIEECLEVIKKESNYLEEMIEELQFISRIDALSMKYSFRALNVTDVILSAEQSLSVKIIKKDITVVNDFLKDCPCIKGDYKTLRQVFVNLLDNAIKYSPAKRRVIVSVKRKDKFIEVAFKDEGVGISAEEKDKIFERFYRCKNGHQREKGIGLGLSIVKEILSAHKSTIRVESQINRGSEFIIAFPIA
jgi:signal transduction histidine kinase